MELGQLTEYNMRNIFLQKSCTKCGDALLKIRIEHISGSIV